MPRQKTLRVTEVYKSIQGESTWVGLPCTFIRLARCHLRCAWCDTEYAFRGGEPVSVVDLVGRCGELDCSLVEITGGEPLIQPNCFELTAGLIERGYTVLVETSGTLPIATLPAEAIKIMDLKCPDSGECGKNDWFNIDALSMRDEVKFVIASRKDYEWAAGVVRQHRLAGRCKAVLISPVFGFVEPADIVQWILEDKLPVRFQLQMHKSIWSPDAKGV